MTEHRVAVISTARAFRDWVLSQNSPQRDVVINWTRLELTAGHVRYICIPSVDHARGRTFAECLMVGPVSKDLIKASEYVEAHMRTSGPA